MPASNLFLLKDDHQSVFFFLCVALGEELQRFEEINTYKLVELWFLGLSPLLGSVAGAINAAAASVGAA